MWIQANTAVPGTCSHPGLSALWWNPEPREIHWNSPWRKKCLTLEIQNSWKAEQRALQIRVDTAQHSNFNLVPKENTGRRDKFYFLPASVLILSTITQDLHLKPFHMWRHIVSAKEMSWSIFLFKSWPGKVETQVSHSQWFIWHLRDPGVTSSSISEVSSQPLMHPEHKCSPCSSIFHLSFWNCPTVQEGLPNQLASKHKDHNVIPEGRRNSTSLTLPHPKTTSVFYQMTTT